MGRSHSTKWTCICAPGRRQISSQIDANSSSPRFTLGIFSILQNGSYGESNCNLTQCEQNWRPAGVCRGRRGYWTFKIALFSLSVLCYANSLDGEFVFDDSQAILNNKNVIGWGKQSAVQNGLQDESGLWTLIENDFWGTPLRSNSSHKSWRPFTTFTFRLNYLLSERDTRSYHLVNIFLHALVTLLSHEFFIVILCACNNGESNGKWKTTKDDSNTSNGSTRTLRPKSAANWASVIFAVHPVHTECVSSIVGRAELLSACFFLCAFFAYHRSTGSNQTVSLALCALCTLLAMISKEQGLTVLGICFLFDTFVVSEAVLKRFLVNLEQLRSDKLNNNSEKCTSLKDPQFMSYLHRISTLAIVGLVLLFIRLYAMGFTVPNFTKLDNPASFHPNFLVRVINYNYQYALNVWLLLNPSWLCFDYSMGCIALIQSGYDCRILIVLTFWAVMAGLVLPATQLKPLQMALFIMAVTFFPISNIPFRVGFVLAERTLYLPSLGSCLLIGMAISRASAKFTSKKTTLTFLSAAVVTILALIGKSIDRSNEWRSESALYRSGVTVCPLNAKIHYNLGIVLSREGKVSEAETAYRTALSLHGEYEQAMNNLGNLLKDMQRLEESETMLEKAVFIRPDFATAWMNLGIVQASLKKYDPSEHSYLTSLRLRWNYPDCHFNLGNLYVERGRFSEAKRCWLTAIEQQPSHAKAWINLMILSDNEEKCEQAVIYGKQALAYINDHAGVHFTLANCLGKLERFEEAEFHFRSALKLNPQSASYWANLGVLLHRCKRYSEAELAYKNAMALDPASVSISKNYRLLQKTRQVEAQSLSH